MKGSSLTIQNAEIANAAGICARHRRQYCGFIEVPSFFATGRIRMRGLRAMLFAGLMRPARSGFGRASRDEN